MSAIAVGTTVSDLTARQVLTIADAALFQAEQAGIEVIAVGFVAGPISTVILSTALGAALAYELGITERRTQPSSDYTKTVDVFEADWCGVRMSIVSSVAAVVAEVAA